MKTKLLTLAAITAVVFNIAQARAETCESGKLVTGNNGHSYCQSNSTMNWWSAYTWCEAQGRHLASMYELCPDTGEGLNNGWDGSNGSQKCANQNASFNSAAWTSTAFQGNKAFRVYTPGVVDSTDRKSACYATCY